MSEELRTRKRWKARRRAGRRLMRLSAASVLSALALVVAACGSSSSGSASSGGGGSGDLRIGAIMALTGQYSPVDAPAADAIKYAVDQLNRAGGVKIGGEKHQIKLFLQDDRSDQTTAVAQAVKLTRDDHVVAIYGPIAGMGLAVSAVTSKANVVQFSPSVSVTPIAGDPQHPLVFSVIPSQQAAANAAVLALHHFAPNAKTAAFFAPNDVACSAASRAIVPALKSQGYNVVGNTLFPADRSDLAPYLARLARQHPDAVITGCDTQTVGTVLKQMDAGGVGKDVVVETFGVGGGSATSEAAAGRPVVQLPFRSVDLSSPTTPVAKQFVQGFLQFTRASALPQETSGLTYYYDYVFMLARAAERAGTVSDPKAIGKALSELSYSGVSGPLAYKSANTVNMRFLSAMYKGSAAAGSYLASSG